MVDIKFKNKILDNFEGSLKDIQKDLLQLEENIKNDEKLNIETKIRILESTYVLETAVYRATLYNLRTELNQMKKDLEVLNTALNTIVKEANYEFLSIVNFKIIALLTFTIDHSNL